MAGFKVSCLFQLMFIKQFIHSYIRIALKIRKALAQKWKLSNQFVAGEVRIVFTLNVKTKDGIYGAVVVKILIIHFQRLVFRCLKLSVQTHISDNKIGPFIA